MTLSCPGPAIVRGLRSRVHIVTHGLTVSVRSGSLAAALVILTTLSSSFVLSFPKRWGPWVARLVVAVITRALAVAGAYHEGKAKGESPSGRLQGPQPRWCGVPADSAPRF